MFGNSAADNPHRPARGGLAVLACLLALVALVVAAACAWRIWQWNGAQASRMASQDARLVAAERDTGAARAQQQTLQRRLEDVQNELRAMHDAQNAFDQRTRNLETALAQLSDLQLQGRDALLLDDAEFLLRAGQQRWSLFHDAGAAARAYTLADDALAQVSDPAFAPVRSGIASERAALTAAMAPARSRALDELASLRAQAFRFPLAGSEHAPRREPDNGIFARTWRALSGILRIERDDGAPIPAADARIARELLALDLAQTQAGLMAFDDSGFHAAAQRADALLVARFDADAPEVRAARARLQALLGAHASTTEPRLGGALAQLRALRASHALRTTAPASAASTSRP